MEHMNLEFLMLKLIETFDKYAGRDGDSRTLSQSELVQLAKAEFPSLCKAGKDDDVLKGICGSMDIDGDKLVTFQEFGTFIVAVASLLKDHICSGKH
ncbi:protein S100-P-like [Lissotriton helveticus]